jgi:hypothetical protein
MARQATGLTPAPTTVVAEQAVFDAAPQPMSPRFDVIEALPPAAADKLRALRQRSTDAHALIPMFADLQEANTERIKAEQRLKRLVDHPHDDGFGLKEDDPRVVAAQRQLDKLTGDAKRLNERNEARSQAWRTASGALAACEDWLRHGKPLGTVLEAVENEPVKLLKNEALIDGVERLRREGRGVKATIHTIQSSCFPKSHSKAQIRAQIEQFAQRGEVSVSDVIEHDGKIIWPMMRVQSQVFNAQPGAVAFHEAIDVAGLLAFLLKPTLISILDAFVDAESDDAAALTHEQRQQREAEAQADLLAVERAEAALVWQAQAQNLPCEHRSDCSPLAILNCQLACVPRAVTSPGSSMQHAWDIVGR